MSLELISITKEDRDKIIDIFREDDIFIYENDDDSNLDYFITKLDDDIDDVFYDHSVPFCKILKELNCICMGFQYNNDYANKNDVNTYYGIWFKKLKEKQEIDLH